MNYAIVTTPFGPFLLAADQHGLRHASFQEGTAAIDPPAQWVRHSDDEALDDAARQLMEYIEGQRTDFDLPLAPQGTPFQQAVWDELRQIPYGMRTSYGEIARRLERPNAARAVGAANGANPLPIFIPCHRVVAADGALQGFTGGIGIKEDLLLHEQKYRDDGGEQLSLLG